jgi:glycosyltransferase involved in cell wall biosynthesis
MAAPDLALISPYPVGGERHGGRSGVAGYTARLAAALAERGAEVAVVAPVEDGAPTRERHGSVRVERRFAAGAGALPRAALAALATGAPVTHLQHETFLYGGPSSVAGLPRALRLLRRGRSRGAVVTMHHVVDPRAVDRAFTRLHRVRAPAAVARAGIAGVQAAIRRHAAAVVVHEPGLAEAVPEARVIPHGVDPVDADRAGARRRLGLEGERRLLALCFGFLAPYKGLEAALEGAREIDEQVRLVVAGGPHPRLATARDAYAERLRERYGGHAHFTGYVPGAAVADWFAAADVALLPYPRPFATSGPLALALGAGTPALLSVPLACCLGASTAEAVVPEPAQIALRLRMLARDAAARERLAAATRELARERSWSQVAERHLELYEEVGRAGVAGGRLRAA